MKMKAAILWDAHQDWSVEEVELDGPFRDTLFHNDGFGVRSPR